MSSEQPASSQSVRTTKASPLLVIPIENVVTFSSPVHHRNRGRGRGRGRGKDPGAVGGKQSGPKVAPEARLMIPPTLNMTDLDRRGEDNAWEGTVSVVVPEKEMGFLVADKGLPKDYKGNSLFFHLSVVKNSTGKTVKITKGSKVKFVLYKARDGEGDALERPKAYAVYVTNLPQAKGEKSKESKQPKAKVAPQDWMTKLAAGNGPPLKVSVFWDIENCKPKMNSILDVVARIRGLVLQGQQVSFKDKNLINS